MSGKYTSNDRMSALINDNPLILMAMSRFGISLGFGDRTIGAICEHQGIDCPTFLAIANYITHGTVDTAGVSVAALMEYLDNAHSYFLDFCLPAIRRKLLEAIDCSGRNEIAMLILKFYDEYVEEVHRHMDYESSEVFGYVRQLLDGVGDDQFNINIFAAHHHSINSKLNELKDIIVRYLPQKDTNLLNAVLFDIISCEQDLVTHCKVEDDIFVPLVRRLEATADARRDASAPAADVADEGDEALSNRERDIIACVARGMSNKEIADSLCISVNTVTTHRRNLVQKLGIHSPAGLTIYAVINGIVDINDLATQL